jgi:hypothetical protein
MGRIDRQDSYRISSRLREGMGNVNEGVRKEAVPIVKSHPMRSITMGRCGLQ